MNMIPRQLPLALGFSEKFGREDFLSGPSNAAALALIERWPDWPARTVVLIGPEGAGKSHLAAIWAAVLSFDTSSGLTFMGLPRNQANMTPPMIRISRDTTRITTQRGTASVMPSAT